MRSRKTFIGLCGLGLVLTCLSIWMRFASAGTMPNNNPTNCLNYGDPNNGVLKPAVQCLTVSFGLGDPVRCGGAVSCLTNTGSCQANAQGLLMNYASIDWENWAHLECVNVTNPHKACHVSSGTNNFVKCYTMQYYNQTGCASLVCTMDVYYCKCS